MAYTLHYDDIPNDLNIGDSVALDTETMGLKPVRDRLCLAQLSTGDGHAHLVSFQNGDYTAPNLKKVLQDPNVTKIFHYARFDVAVFQHYLNVECTPVYCTKIASKLCRTFTDRHGLKELCRELLSIELSKEKQSSDWGSDDLTDEQLKYAANDVLYLHKLRDKLNSMLVREDREAMAQSCFEFLQTRAGLDLLGWEEIDIFAHS